VAFVFIKVVKRMAVHSFKDKLKQSKEDELILDTHFSKDFYVIETELDVDREGIDRIFVHRETYKPYTVEYKCDRRTNDTGNAFIEICSVSRDNLCTKKGWAYTCNSRFLIYYDVIGGIIYITETDDIKKLVEDWKEVYRIGRSFNATYSAKGVLLPVTELEKISKKRIL